MTLPGSGTMISLLDIANEFGGGEPHSLGEYDNTDNSSLPAAGNPIDFADFYGLAKKGGVPGVYVQSNTPNSSYDRLQWANSGDEYQVQGDYDSNFGSPHIDVTITVSEYAVFTNTQDYSDRSYWRVRARYTGGDWSAWSATDSIDEYKKDPPPFDGD